MRSGKYKAPSVGDTFGYLTVESSEGTIGKRPGIYLFKCRCICGEIKYATFGQLKMGHTTNCGCVKHQRVLEMNQRKATHHKTPRVEYQIWIGMRKRCLNSTGQDYRNYGGRGITICERWSDFTNFLADMGLRPSRKHSIDRYPDNNGPYSPENCRWATPGEQGRNTRVNRLLTINGVTMIQSEWAKITGVPADTIQKRLARGWPTEKAVYLPPRIMRKSKRQRENAV